MSQPIEEADQELTEMSQGAPRGINFAIVPKPVGVHDIAFNSRGMYYSLPTFIISAVLVGMGTWLLFTAKPSDNNAVAIVPIIVGLGVMLLAMHWFASYHVVYVDLESLSTTWTRYRGFLPRVSSVYSERFTLARCRVCAPGKRSSTHAGLAIVTSGDCLLLVSSRSDERVERYLRELPASMQQSLREGVYPFYILAYP